MMRRPHLLWFLLGLAQPGCGGDEGPRIDLELAPDLNVNRAEDVAGAVDSLLFILDSPDGLYAPDEAQSDAKLRIDQADDDPDLELLATAPVREGRLPLVRIERGGLAPDVALSVRVLGLPVDGQDAVALGSVQGLGFDTPQVTIPFNLIPEHLPPRVAEVVPGNGDSLPGCGIERMVLVFSKKIDPASILADGAVEIDGDPPSQIRVDASGRFAELIPENLSGGLSLDYHLTVATLVRDEAGRALDQVPAEEGDQPFDQEFTHPCTIGPNIPDLQCGSGTGATWCGLSQPIECIDDICVPATCEGLSCAEGTVCDPTTNACEIDCRVYGPLGPCTCDEQTGTCSAGS